MMIRLPDWATRLAGLVAERKSSPFVWGVNDCGLFVADGILAMTGVDVAGHMRGRYETEKGAIELIADLRRFVEGIADTHSCPPVSRKYLRRGDVAFIVSDKGYSLGLVMLDGKHVAIPGDLGLTFYPIRIARRGWQVG